MRAPQPAFRKRALTPYVFILPFGVLFILFFIVPILYAIYQSLFRSERSGLGLGAASVSFNVSIVGCNPKVTWTLTAPWNANRFENGTLTQAIDFNRGSKP